MNHIFSKARSNRLFSIFIGNKGKNVWFFSVLILLSAAVALLEGTSFGFLAIGMSGLQSTSPPSSMLLKDWMGISHFSGMKLFLFGTSLAIFFQLFRSATNYLCTAYSIKLAIKIQNELQREIFKQILRFSYGHISQLKIGGLLEIARGPVNFINPLFDCLLKIFSSVLTAIVILFMMISLSPMLTIVTITLFVLFGLIQKSILRVILKSSDKLSKTLMSQNQETSQVLHGTKVIQTFFQQKTILNKLDTRIEAIGNICKKLYTISYIAPYINEIFSVSIIGSILLFSVLFVGVENNAFVSILITFLTVSYRLSTRLQICIGAFGYVGTHYGCLLRSNEILQNHDKEFYSPDGIPFKSEIQNISFNNVSFSYRNRNDEALKSISFSISKGLSIGIVGLSGSGKTSLIDLLLRLYEPSSGAITANGSSIQSFSLESWRAKFGVVAQDSFLFDDTVESNIRFGRIDASFESIKEAARAAEIDDFIESLPSGYQTTIGERGLHLSGGERQRLALARALLRDPEVLVLDEATSNLDSQSEFFIQKVLEKMRGKKTIVTIAHRLSTVNNCDLILVIEKGVLIEEGNHDYLLNQSKRYSQLWTLQANVDQRKLQSMEAR